MDWTVIQEAIRLSVASATGLTETRVQWENAAIAGAWSLEPSIRLSLKTPQGVGVDETRHVYDVDSDSLLASQEGVRQILVTVRIQSQSQTPGQEAPGTLAGKLRTRLRRPAVLAVLQAGGVALATIQPTVNADRKLEGRMVSMALTDVVFSAAETDTDTTASGDYIQRVTGLGTFNADQPDEKTTPLDVSRD